MLEQLNSDIKDAMKSKAKEKLTALRYLKSMIMENNTSKKPSSEMDVAIKHHKNLKGSLVNYPDGHAMRAQIENEIEIIGAYLPQQMSEEEVATLINNIKEAQDTPNMGAVMKDLQPQIKGRFDGKKASQMVKDALS
jgi:uncharacterized protein YqeY